MVKKSFWHHGLRVQCLVHCRHLNDVKGGSWKPYPLTALTLNIVICKVGIIMVPVRWVMRTSENLTVKSSLYTAKLLGIRYGYGWAKLRVIV